MSGVDPNGGIAKQQQEELRLLSERYRNGQINDAQYKLGRENAIARAQARLATCRSSDGLVSTKALIVDTSYGPLLVKAGIAVVVLAVSAQLGWLGIKKYIIDYRPTLSETPAVAEAPPSAPASTHTTIASAPKPSVPLDTQPQHVMAGVLPSAASSSSQSLTTHDVNEAMTEPIPPLDAEPVPLTMTMTAMETRDSAPFELAATPAKPALAWLDDLPEASLDQEHPFKKWCQRVRLMQRGQMKAFVGVAAGPEAKDLRDAAYLRFRDQRRADFEQTSLKADNTRKVVTLPHSVRSGKIMVERMTTNDPHTRNLGMLVTTVHDGRAFAYYFEGDNRLLVQFNVAVGSAKYTPAPGSDPAAQSAPDEAQP